MVINRVGPVFLVLTLCIFTRNCHARTVTNIEIKAVGMNNSNDKNAAGACKQFRPTKNQIVRFFNKAYPVEAHMLTEERYSSCYAEGKLDFSDGHSGKWILYSSGIATFIFTRGDVVYLFRKNNKWHDPYSCTYGLSEKAEC